MGSLGINVPALIVVGISVVIGLLMVVVFGYASDQKAIHVTKDHLKAHLLALRLFQDQLPVVVRSYGRIFQSTGRYLQLAFTPLLFVIVPLIFLIVQADRYLGFSPFNSGQSFLIKARVADASTLNNASLELPDGLAITAPAVHIPAENEIAWRVSAERKGDYVINIQTGDQTFSKRVVVGSGLPRLSPVRLRGEFWKRLFESSEPAIAANEYVESIEVHYPARVIAFAGFEWNWIWLFFVLSLVAGFVFKSILGIEI